MGKQIWVNGMDPNDPHKDPDKDLEEAEIGQEFWPWESSIGSVSIQDLKDAADKGKRNDKSV